MRVALFVFLAILIAISCADKPEDNVMTTPASQTVVINSPLPSPAGTAPIADGAGNWNAQTVAVALARNFAQGPAANTPLALGQTQIPWATIESGAPAGVDVPITPVQTGRVRIQCMIAVRYDGADVGESFVQVQAQIGGVTINFPQPFHSMIAGDRTILPFLAETTLPVGSTSNVEILMTTPIGSLTVEAQNSTIDVQEVSAVTG